MKSYHLTQEQIAQLLEAKGYHGDSFKLVPKMTDIVNAALDQVLGEPVAEAFIDSFGDLKIYPTGIASKALIVERGDSKLYAPKEQS